MTPIKNKEEKAACGTKFWPILLMIVHGCFGSGFFLTLVDVHRDD